MEENGPTCGVPNVRGEGVVRAILSFEFLSSRFLFLFLLPLYTPHVPPSFVVILGSMCPLRRPRLPCLTYHVAPFPFPYVRIRMPFYLRPVATICSLT